MSNLFEKGEKFIPKEALQPVIASVTTNRLTYLNIPALNALWRVVKENHAKGVLGDIVEAGCALGGSAIVLAHAKEQSTTLKVFDVFEMIPEPSARDGEDVIDRYGVIKAGESKGIGGEGLYYGYETDLIKKVESSFLLHDIELAAENVELIQGDFKETLPKDKGALSLAHIDCDWYDSTMICLVEFWPRLSLGGRLIVDDYYHWSGSASAVDAYFGKQPQNFKFEKIENKLHIRKIA